MITEPEPVYIAKQGCLCVIKEHSWTVSTQLSMTDGKCLSANIEVDAAVRYEGYYAQLEQVELWEEAPSGSAAEPVCDIIQHKATPGVLAVGNTYSVGSLALADLLPAVKIASSLWESVTALISYAVNRAFQPRVNAKGKPTSDDSSKKLHLVVVGRETKTIPASTKFMLRLYYKLD